MNTALYQAAIKQLATTPVPATRLAAANGSAELDNPLCGDRVRMEVQLSNASDNTTNATNARIVALAHETRGCLLCRASATLLARHATGLALSEAAPLREGLRDYLQGKSAVPPALPHSPPTASPGAQAANAPSAPASSLPSSNTDADWSVFAPAREHAGRHGCILLPLDALLAALQQAQAAPSPTSPPSPPAPVGASSRQQP